MEHRTDRSRRTSRLLAALLTFLPVALACLLAVIVAPAQAEDGSDAAPRRILIVSTSRAVMGDAARPTGANAREIVEAYERFTLSGYALEFASPAGGAVPLEALAALEPKQAATLRSPDLAKSLAATARLGAVDASRFRAVYIAGGHGALWDLPDDAALQQLIRATLARNGVVGAVGQGVGALLNVKLDGDVYLLAGRTATGSTDAEEVAEGLFGTLPFQLQTSAADHGALWNNNGAFKPNVVVSRRVVTGQNAISAPGVVHFMVQLLEKSAVQSGPAEP